MIDWVEKREIDVDTSVSVTGLDSIQSAFSSFVEGNQQKQVVSLTNSDDQQLIKVSVFTLSTTRLYLIVI